MSCSRAYSCPAIPAPRVGQAYLLLNPPGKHFICGEKDAESHLLHTIPLSNTKEEWGPKKGDLPEITKHGWGRAKAWRQVLWPSTPPYSQTVKEPDRGVAYREHNELESGRWGSSVLSSKETASALAGELQEECYLHRICRDTAARTGRHSHACVNSRRPRRFSFPTRDQSYGQDYHPH